MKPNPTSLDKQGLIINQLKCMKIYTKTYLLEKLKNIGLVHSYKTLIKYEKKRLIPHGGNIKCYGSKDRFYTIDEIKKIVNKIKKLRRNR
jgi:hypothetical protein